MAEPDERPPAEADDGFDRGYDGPRRRQATRGLELTPAERLRWLEETMETLRLWQGRAQNAPPLEPRPGDAGGSTSRG